MRTWWRSIYLARYSGLRLPGSETLSIEANLTNALSRQNIRVDVPCGSPLPSPPKPESCIPPPNVCWPNVGTIQELAKDILFGQLRLVIATMTIEEINSAG
jgi:flotillin